MARTLVLVTDDIYWRGEPVYTSAGDLECVRTPAAEDALAEAIERSGARYCVIGSSPYRGRLYATLPRGGVLARFGVGHENVDKAKATEAGLYCTNTPNVLQQSVAEITMAMIAAAARHVLGMSTAMREGKWSQQQGLELQGKTLAIAGCGEIGRAVARIASAGYGMRVLGYRRRPRPPAAGDEHFERMSDDFADVVRDADFLSLHIPGSAENVRFIDRSRVDLLPPRAWLINTARGSVVDEAALFDALSSGRLAGAALDVFEREPYQPSDPARDLRTLPNVILLPHVGSHTAEANRRMAERALRNIRLAIAGDRASMDLLNPEVTV